jgi:hypothetical protein
MAPVSLDSLDFVPPAGLSGAGAFLWCVVLLGLGPGTGILYMLLLARAFTAAQARGRAELFEGSAQPLTAGPHRVVRGKVDVDGTDEVAVEVDIEQRVRDVSNKNGTHHEWREVDRKVRALPFYLLQPQGDPVYVEPGGDPFLVDLLATRYPDSRPFERIRAADVRRGEEFFVYGDLHQGSHPRARTAYRDGSPGWVLKAPRTGRMLMATDIIRDRFKGRISYLLNAGLLCGAFFLFVHSVFTLPYVAAMLGKQGTAKVVETRSWTTTSKHGPVEHYGITAVAEEDELSIEQEVPQAAYAAVEDVRARGHDANVPTLRFGKSGWCCIGSASFVFIPFLIIATIISSTAAILLALVYREQIPWYDRARLNEHGGQGRWPETRPAEPVDPRVD